MNSNPRRSWISRFFGASVPAKAPKGKNAFALEALETRLAPAADFFIDPVFGNNANSGTQASPWATLQFAIDNPAVNNGDTLKVAPGPMQENGKLWAANGGDVVSVLVNKSLIIQGTKADWSQITNAGDVACTIEMGSQGLNSQAMLVIDAPNVTVTGLGFTTSTSDPANPVNGQGNLILVDSTGFTLMDSVLDGKRANADTQAVPGTAATALFFYDPAPVVNSSNVITGSSITSFTVSDNIIGGTIILANGTGYGTSAPGTASPSLVISGNTITKGLYGAVYLMGDLDATVPTGSLSDYDTGLPTLTGNDFVSDPFAANPSDPADANNGAFQSIYTIQSTRPGLAYLTNQLSQNIITNYVAVVTSAGTVRQQGSATTTYGYNVFPYLDALSGVTEYYLDAGESENTPTQSGDTILVSAPDISSGAINYNNLTANGVTLEVNNMGTLPFAVTLSEYTPPSASTPYALSLTLARGAGTNLTADVGVIANSGNNVLTGDAGRNSFTGGAGNDMIDGIAGEDTVYFFGAFTDYSFSYNSTTGILQVTDTRSGSPDGTDQLKNITFLVFDNGGSPETFGVAGTGTSINDLIANPGLAGAIITGNHTAENVVLDRDFVLTGAPDSATGTNPSAASIALTNNAILGVGSGNFTAPAVTVDNGSTISDGVYLTAKNGTLTVQPGTYTTINDNNVVFYQNITLATNPSGPVVAGAFTLQNGAVLSGAISDFSAPSVTVNPGSQIAQGMQLVEAGGSLFLNTGTYNEDVVINKTMFLVSQGGLATINGSTSAPLTINNPVAETVYLEGLFSFTSSATTTPSIQVGAGSFLGLVNNGCAGTAQIVLAAGSSGAQSGGNLELYGPASGGQLTISNRVTMGNNSSVYAYGNYTPTMTGILEYTSGATVVLGAANVTGSGSILTISGPIIDNGVVPTLVASSPNQVVIVATLVASLESQTLNTLNTLTSVPSFKVNAVINGSGGGVNASTLAGAMSVELPDGSLVPVTATYSNGTFVGTGIIAEYTITPNGATWQAGPEGLYNFYLTGVKDNGGNTLPKTFITSVRADFTKPTLTITPGNPDPTNLEATTFTITFDQDIQGFTQSDVSVTNGSITDFQVDLYNPRIYTVTVSAIGTGPRVVTMEVGVPAGVVTDNSGNPNTAATASITFDNVRPTTTLAYPAGASPTNNPNLVFTVTFSEAVIDFASNDVQVVNGVVLGGSFIQTGPKTYQFTVNPLAQGPVEVSIPENIAEDAAGNPNQASSTINLIYDAVQPSTTLASTDVSGGFTSKNPVMVTITLGESGCSLRNASLLTVTGGTAGTITPVPGSTDKFTVAITPTNPGAQTAITVTAGNGTFIDPAGNLSAASAPFSFTYRPAVSQGLSWSTNSGNQVVVKKTDGTTSTVTVFPGWSGGIRVAAADVTGDGVQDLVVVPTAGGAPNVVVINGDTLATAASFYAFAAGYKGGLTVAAGDLTGDGIADIVVGSGGGAQATVTTFAGGTFTNLKNFFAYTGYTGQVNVGTVDVAGTGVRDIITGTGLGTRGHVVVFDYATLGTVASFYAFAAGTTSGAYVAAGNLNPATAADEIAVGSGGNMQATVNLFSPTGVQLNSLPAFSGFQGAAKVTVTDYNGDGVIDLAIGAGPGAEPSINVLNGETLAVIDSFFGYPENWTNGINFGA